MGSAKLFSGNVEVWKSKFPPPHQPWWRLQETLYYQPSTLQVQSPIQKHLENAEVDSTRSIANVRIHVEQVIGAVRQKYTMLESTIPINLVMKREGKEHPALDKIVLVACALTNICPSIVSTD